MTEENLQQATPDHLAEIEAELDALDRQSVETDEAVRSALRDVWKALGRAELAVRRLDGRR